MSTSKPQTQKSSVPSSPDALEIVQRWDDYIADLPSEISLERATAEAGHINEWIRRYDTGSMVAKFCLGTIAYLANPEWRDKREYGKGIISTLSERHSINANVLREARRCAEFFGLDLALYYQWLTENDDRVKTWTDVRRIIRAWDDPEVLGPDALADRLATRIESTGDDLQRLRERVHEGHIDEETYEGVKNEFVDEVESFDEVKDEALEEQDQTIETPRDQEYVNWAKAHECVATGSPPPNEPHHVEQRGQGIKGSDYSVIPVASEVHDTIEDKGHRYAEKKYGFDIAEALYGCLHEYLFGYQPGLPPDISYRRRGPEAEALDARSNGRG